jgi:hypothetical protein
MSELEKLRKLLNEGKSAEEKTDKILQKLNENPSLNAVAAEGAVKSEPNSHFEVAKALNDQKGRQLKKEERDRLLKKGQIETREKLAQARMEVNASNLVHDDSLSVLVEPDKKTVIIFGDKKRELEPEIPADEISVTKPVDEPKENLEKPIEAPDPDVDPEFDGPSEKEESDKEVSNMPGKINESLASIFAILREEETPVEPVEVKEPEEVLDDEKPEVEPVSVEVDLVADPEIIVTNDTIRIEVPLVAKPKTELAPAEVDGLKESLSAIYGILAGKILNEEGEVVGVEDTPEAELNVENDELSGIDKLVIEIKTDKKPENEVSDDEFSTISEALSLISFIFNESDSTDLGDEAVEPVHDDKETEEKLTPEVENEDTFPEDEHQQSEEVKEVIVEEVEGDTDLGDEAVEPVHDDKEPVADTPEVENEDTFPEDEHEQAEEVKEVIVEEVEAKESSFEFFVSESSVKITVPFEGEINYEGDMKAVADSLVKIHSIFNSDPSAPVGDAEVQIVDGNLEIIIPVEQPKEVISPEEEKAASAHLEAVLGHITLPAKLEEVPADVALDTEEVVEEKEEEKAADPNAEALAKLLLAKDDIVKHEEEPEEKTGVLAINAGFSIDTNAALKLLESFDLTANEKISLISEAASSLYLAEVKTLLEESGFANSKKGLSMFLNTLNVTLTEEEVNDLYDEINAEKVKEKFDEEKGSKQSEEIEEHDIAKEDIVDDKKEEDVKPVEEALEEAAGGNALDMTVKDIAEKHGVDVGDIEKQIKIGVEIEQEHTSDEEQAKKIAMDHLVEFPDYYDRLVKMEKEAEEELEIKERKAEDKVQPEDVIVKEGVEGETDLGDEAVEPVHDEGEPVELTPEVENEDTFPEDEHEQVEEVEEVIVESKKYTSLKEAFLLEADYFNNPSVLNITAEDKKQRLVEQISLLIAKDQADPLYEELVQATAYAKTIQDKLNTKYTKLAEAKSEEMIKVLTEKNKLTSDDELKFIEDVRLNEDTTILNEGFNSFLLKFLPERKLDEIIMKSKQTALGAMKTPEEKAAVEKMFANIPLDRKGKRTFIVSLTKHAPEEQLAKANAQMDLLSKKVKEAPEEQKDAASIQESLIGGVIAGGVIGSLSTILVTLIVSSIIRKIRNRREADYRY